MASTPPRRSASAKLTNADIPLIKISQTESVERAENEEKELGAKRFKAIESINQANLEQLQEVISENARTSPTTGTKDPANQQPISADQQLEPAKTVTFHTQKEQVPSSMETINFASASRDCWVRRLHRPTDVHTVVTQQIDDVNVTDVNRRHDESGSHVKTLSLQMKDSFF